MALLHRCLLLPDIISNYLMFIVDYRQASSQPRTAQCLMCDSIPCLLVVPLVPSSAAVDLGAGVLCVVGGLHRTCKSC